jgi:hypothetical protein
MKLLPKLPMEQLRALLQPEPNGDKQPSLAIGTAATETAGYYMGWEHGLIHRHIETMEINSDQSARWQLMIDLELPNSPEASYASHDGQGHFLFPLLFSKKAEGRTGFGVVAEDEKILAIPTRAKCDTVSAAAALQAGRRILDSRARRSLPADLEARLLGIVTMRPLPSSAVLAALEDDLDPEVHEVWRKSGFLEDLHMLVEHLVIWMPFRGIPGERRVIRVRHDHELTPRPFIRWIFGELKQPLFPSIRRRRARQLRAIEAGDVPGDVLFTGDKAYGRRRYRVSIRALGERVAKPFAWMPIEFDFPSIYPRRCASYHFELACPDGLTPRSIKLVVDEKKKRSRWERDVARPEKTNSEELTLRTGSAHVYLPGGTSLNEVRLRATLGVGPGAFPILWFFTGAITTIVLWTLAAVDPEELAGKSGGGKDQIAAGILLVVPALLGGLVFGVESRSISRLLSGARVLVLVAGLSAVGAATVLIRQPFGISCGWAWTICAGIATAATVPLATSWMLSVPVVWSQLEKLNTVERQHRALALLDIVAALLLFGLTRLGDAPLPRAAGGTALVLMTVPFILLASNRGAVTIKDNLRYIAFPASAAALTCLVLGCFELHATTDPKFLHSVASTAEIVGMAILALSFLSVFVARRMSRSFEPGSDEVDIKPEVGRALIAGDRIYELAKLRKEEVAHRAAGHIA